MPESVVFGGGKFALAMTKEVSALDSLIICLSSFVYSMSII